MTLPTNFAALPDLQGLNIIFKTIPHAYHKEIAHALTFDAALQIIEQYVRDINNTLRS